MALIVCVLAAEPRYSGSGSAFQDPEQATVSSGRNPTLPANICMDVPDEVLPCDANAQTFFSETSLAGKR